MSQNLPFPFAGQPAVATPQQHNTSQTQAPTMAAPPAGSDMASLLAGMNITPDQLAKIAYLMQTGQLTLPPPPPPTLPVATPPAPPSNQAPPAPAADPRLNRQAPARDVDMDKEDGEVEEGEVDDMPEPVSREFLRTPPKGPRKRSRSPLPRFNNAQDARRHSQQHQRQPSPRAANGISRTSALNSSTNATHVQTNGDAGDARKAARNAAAKDIVLKLHNNGYSFDDVAKAISNRKVLRRVYNQLGLQAVSPEPAPGTLLTTAAVKSPVSEPQRKASQPKKAAPSKPATVDRSAYLAKLQAAKNKKAEPTAASASPIDKPRPSIPTTIKSVSTAAAATVPALAEKVASKNDLIRQRMAALAAERAAKEEAKRKVAEAAENGEVVVISSDEPQHNGTHDSSKPGLGDGHAGIRASEVVSDQHSPLTPRNISSGTSSQVPNVPQQPSTQQIASPTLNRGFGLPGLFTTSSPLSPASFLQQQTAAFAPPPGPAVQSRPDSASAINHTSAQKRPYGQITHTSAQKRPYGQINDDGDDRVVIVDSDEDDSEDDMDIDDDGAPGGSTVITGGASAPGLLRDFPPRPTLSKLATCVPGTPGTPGTPSQAQLKMDQEIADMKRKIAEAESRKRRKTGSTGQAQQVMTPSAEVVATERVQSTSTPGAEPGKLSLKEQREQLEQRLRDLQWQGIGTGFISPPAPVTAGPSDVQGVNGTLDGRPISSGRTLPKTASHVPALLDGPEVVDGEDGDDYEPDFDLVPTSPDGQPVTEVASETQLSNDQNLTVGAAVGSNLPPTHDLDAANRPHESEDVAQPSGDIEENDEDIDDDDDDDLDDIYADAADLNTMNEVRHPAPTTIPAPDYDQDDTDDAMDTSGDSTEAEPDGHESEEEYEPEFDTATSRSAQERQTTSSELNQGADLQMRMEADQSPREASEDDSSSAASSPTGDAADGFSSERTNDTTAEPAAGTIANIIAPELQSVVEEPVVPRTEPSHPTTSFKSYESPLVRFKDFRYHPEFAKTVSGGHRSLTYSNSIDAMKVLCPFEAAGQECKDPSCIHQHFKDMNLSDNDLLRLIGADRTPARTPEESQRWKNGLTAVVQSLRATNVGKDVECIATRIAEYRREFLGDPTQTILLK
ncbi:NURS complex subunit red1 [Fulvia fulva]|uniref:NURS complex subunit red1 n=1 Tax=Passalora fulva TaxID=5499 RepID=A0A9Q8LHQ2_PASFU|nr:NURS complex subunit red1 [Fulvia fulva]KAK4624591.1 NURS complex subunit red1 [Fulvia fulva]KAK4625836.1 NURS complex subunit red1 [Fulvia fulva]UJO17575.1 NURS complex subunit red1 [Fulvia fulva]WPV15319.1 NURS complex subunit red1 [Fulvia fulva]WPV30237.1 NURS complex subunit red1 [Fulvia fulva]